MSIAENIARIKEEVGNHIKLIAVSKTKPEEAIIEAYNAGQRLFGENYVQELADKHEHLPKDIEWHFIGHLQSNKVKYIAPFVYCIHAVDSISLLKEINKQAVKNNRTINCLLQIHIANEETKFGLSYTECNNLLISEDFKQLNNIKICGLMGMASNTDDIDQIKIEFQHLNQYYTLLKKLLSKPNVDLKILSSGMSNDYKIAIANGSTHIRLGSVIFGERNYNK